MHTPPIRRLFGSSAAPVFPALFAFALLFQVGTVGRAVAESSPKTAVVLDPKVEGPIIPQDLAEIEKAVQAELQQQQFQVTSKGERDGIMSSTGNLKGCYRNDCLEQLGRLLGAHIVLAYKIKVQIVEVPVQQQVVQQEPPKGKGKKDKGAQEPAPEPLAAASPLVWQINASLYDIEVGAIGARVETKCEHCSGPKVAQETAELIKQALFEDASKARGGLEIISDPANSSVLVDGVELGVTPYKRQTFVGKHEITVRHTGYKSTNQEIVINDTKKTSLNFQLEPGKDPVQYIKEYGPRPKWRLALGGALIGVGVIGIGVGAYGLAINGKCVDEIMPPALVCNQVRNGIPGGLGFLIGGGVVAAAGAVMLALPGPKNPLAADQGPDTFGDKTSAQPAAKPATSAALSVGGIGSGYGLQMIGTF